MSVKFWYHTLLEGLMPGGRGYRRHLRKFKVHGYLHERDKSNVRKKHFDKEGWQSKSENEDFLYRDYSSYEEYVEHQKSKFDEIIKIKGGFDTKTTIKYRLQFFDRFKDLKNLLPLDAKILCAGARQGTEVEVLRDLGFRDAYGIDLNPGPNNPLVKIGDFLNLDVSDGSLDMIYSNAIDHAFNLDSLFKEHARAIRQDGYVYYDIALQDGGVFEAVHWKADDAVFQLMLKYFNSVERVSIDGGRRWKSVILKGKR